MAKTRETLIDQINQLYVVANDGSTTTAEAETALLAAQRLAAKYKVSPEELATRQGGSAVRWIKIEGGMVVNVWRTHLAAVIAANFRCRMLQGVEPVQTRFTRQPGTRKCLFFLGHDNDVVIAVRSYVYAVRVGDDQLFRYLVGYRAEHPQATQVDLDGARDQWSHGYVTGIRAKFALQTERKSSSTALMTLVPDDVAAEAEAHTDAQRQLPTKVTEEEFTEHFKHGYVAGRQTGDGNLELHDGSTLDADLAEVRQGHRMRR